MAELKDDSYPTRPSLLFRLKDTQDPRSWQEFNDLYGKLIFGFAIKAGLTEAEAQEVVQDTLIAAAKHLPEFRYNPQRCAFKTWLLNLSHWRVQDQLRKRHKSQSRSASRSSQSTPDDLAEDGPRTATIDRVADPAGSELEGLWEKEWQTTLLEAALAAVKPVVDPKQWQIFDLYVLKEWAVRDVARALDISAGRVYLARHRISLLVKKELKKT
jgi:RNA polymerase sigma-70 factor (ECF subfamily)